LIVNGVHECSKTIEGLLFPSILALGALGAGSRGMPTSRRKKTAAVPAADSSSEDSSDQEIGEDDYIGGRFTVGKLLGSVSENIF